MAKPTTTQRKYLFDIEAQWYHHLQTSRGIDSDGAIPSHHQPCRQVAAAVLAF